MFRKALIRLGVGLFLVASVTVLAAASGGSAGLNFVTAQPWYSHDGATTKNECPGVGIPERHYCLVVTTYTNFHKSGGVEVDLTLQNYDQSSLTNPVTHLSWTETDATLSFVSSAGSPLCSRAVPTPDNTAGQVDCSFPNLPGLGSAAGSGSHTPCPVTPAPSGPICSTVKLFFSVDAAPSVSGVNFTATAHVKESQPNGANADQQTVDQSLDPTAGVMKFGQNPATDATFALPENTSGLELDATSPAPATVKFGPGSRPFLAQFQASSPTSCFAGIACQLLVETDLHTAPSGTFSSNKPILWTADINATNTNVVAVHYYDAVSITASAKTFTAQGFASCDGVNFSESPGGNVAAGQDYFVINRTTSGTFQVAATASGKPLTFTGSGSFLGSCIRIIGDQKAEKTTSCTLAPAQMPALYAAKVADAAVPTVHVCLWDAANGKISY
jgi:hypothetical protein